MKEIITANKKPSKYSQLTEHQKNINRLSVKNWQQSHIEHRREYMKRYKQTEKWHIYRKQYDKKWWQQNKEKDTIRRQQWYAVARSWWNDQRRISFKKARETLFHVLEQHACIKCGYHDKRALQFDHINGGGTKEHKTMFLNRRLMFYVYYSLHPELARRTLQVLCANCNAIKRIENGEKTPMP